MNYCKITTEGQAQMMPNPFRLVVANPTEEKKALIAELDNWLEMVYTDPPEYDPETQYLVDHWEEQNGKAVQVWEIKELPPQPEEPTYEELEEAVETYKDGDFDE